MHGLLRLSISWALALVVFSDVVRRVAPERDAPRSTSTVSSTTTTATKLRTRRSLRPLCTSINRIATRTDAHRFVWR